ncbi:DUF3168 domain-containing protein [Mesorhizobium sp. WSM2239]|uniref:DUF3168 domain-containing protein n=2 Tax=unclassified Mesorhizobium TaxID=325217 RepID=A0AAU8DJH1_9HYPH
MTDLAGELRAVLLTRLRECEAFSKGVAGAIADQERDEYPFAWVAVTQSVERPELLATVHVWVREGHAAAVQLVQAAQAALSDAPSIKNASIASWSLSHSEFRYDNDHEAQHGIARFLAEFVDCPDSGSTPDQPS